ncbi:hypothetical protein [Paeniglutamicibacter terrestris]|uniref:Uncharacterized protein n=1 Tax=Paeniglutamicibacter terrestris TaxID=2723403 RepID=A0ABX1G615_9MICC|nr:hypothetical protein [Paeniglutamicibacter terrestris]NKG20960.1 hypothetical protein [Paeniglutamicibacter terrestris]
MADSTADGVGAEDSGCARLESIKAKIFSAADPATQPYNTSPATDFGPEIS